LTNKDVCKTTETVAKLEGAR